MKKVLITGSTGMLGSDLVHIFMADKRYEVYGLSRNPNLMLPGSRQFLRDLSDTGGILAIRPRPDIIIHTAALTDLNLCERDKELAERVHVEASYQLASLMEPQDRFVYISTDSVFDGKKGNYSETDMPNPLNVYAATKWRGEQAVQTAKPHATCVIRTNIYGLHTTQGHSLAEWASKEWAVGKKISGFSDIFFNAVYTLQLASIIKYMIDQDIHYPVLNIGSSLTISKFDFLNNLRSELNVNEGLLTDALSSDFPSALARPKNTSLNTALLSGIHKVPDFASGIQALSLRIRGQRHAIGHNMP